jgi:hypothetical protein
VLHGATIHQPQPAPGLLVPIGGLVTVGSMLAMRDVTAREQAVPAA